MRSQNMWIALLTVTVSLEATATLGNYNTHGQSLAQFPVPVSGRPNEICFYPHHPEGVKYRNKDIEIEKGLCSADIYRNAAACPKTSSTNPGVEFFTIPQGMTPDQVRAANCKVPDPRDSTKNLAKKIAKYKLSTSCSYTPSMLAYYHLSRYLGGILNVPVAVLRTMDLNTHLRIGDRAIRMTSSLPSNDNLIYLTWSRLVRDLRAKNQSSNRDKLLTSDYEQSYGALVEAVKDAEFYKAYFNGGTDRAATFRDKNAIFAALRNSDSVTRTVGREFNVVNLQKMQQLKDAANFIVLDALLNQEDRFGNIDYVLRYVYQDRSNLNERGAPNLASKKSLTPEEIKTLGAVQIKEIALTDNDCGVSRENRVRAARLPELIGHIDPKTYRNLLKLNAWMDQPDAKVFFTNTLLFTSDDFSSVRRNVKEISALLRERCRVGKLKLDLDMEAFFAGLNPTATSCEAQ